MRAVVTGAAGFIGSRLCASLLDWGHTVIGIDCVTDYYDVNRKQANLGHLLGRQNFAFVRQDLLDADLDALLAFRSCVFHLAGQPGVRASWGEGFDAYLRNNVKATQRLLETCRHADVERLVYSSSSSIYGDSLTHPTSESALPHPRSPYGVTKLAAEHLVSLYACNWGVPTVSLRYFTVYGAGQRPDMAIERLVAAARSGAEFRVFGDGTQSRDYTHVSDVVRANLMAAQAEVEPGAVFNIAGGSQATLSDVINEVQRAVQQPIRLRWEPASAGDVQKTSADTSLAREVLGWRPTVSLADGIAEQVCR